MSQPPDLTTAAEAWIAADADNEYRQWKLSEWNLAVAGFRAGAAWAFETAAKIAAEVMRSAEMNLAEGGEIDGAEAADQIMYRIRARAAGSER